MVNDVPVVEEDEQHHLPFTLNFNMHALFGLLYLLCQSYTLKRDMVCSDGITLHGSLE